MNDRHRSFFVEQLSAWVYYVTNIYITIPPVSLCAGGGGGSYWPCLLPYIYEYKSHIMLTFDMEFLAESKHDLAMTFFPFF